MSRRIGLEISRLTDGVSLNGLSSNPRRPLIEEVDPPVRESSPHQSGQVFDDAIDAVFERGD
jgi:hypothetical protein